jgi:2-iminobutanoate/2-iminopropanoate deaminase
MAESMNKHQYALEPKKFPWLDASRYSFSLGMHTPELTFLSGHTASRYIEEKNIVSAAGTLEEQLDIVYKKIQSIKEISQSKSILHFIEYITPKAASEMKIINQTRKKILQNEQFTHTQIMSNRLLRKEALIEIEIIYNNLSDTGELLYISKTGNNVGTLAQQTENIYQEADKSIKQLGLNWGNVVNTTEFIRKDVLHEYKETNSVRKKYFSAPYPASTGIIMKKLMQEDQLIQVHFTLSRASNEIVNPYEKWHPALTFSPAIKADNLIFISGIAAFDYATGDVLYPGDIEKQTEYIFREIDKILQACGGSLKNIVRTVDYVVNDGLANYAKTDKIRKKLLSHPFPTSTGIVCERLIRKGLMVEIETIGLLEE